MLKSMEDHRNALKNVKPKVWATIIPSRTTKPIVSLHTQCSHAKNAVKASHMNNKHRSYDSSKGGYPLAEAEVYQLIDNEWILQWRIEEGTYPHDLPWIGEK